MPHIARIALDTPLDRLFDYRVPAALRLGAGDLVEVPFGRGCQVGVVIETGGESPLAPDKLKTVLRRLDDRPPVDRETLALARFCADYYHYPLGPIVLATLPPRLREARPFRAATPWLTLTAAGSTAQPARRAHGQRSLLDALRLAGALHRDAVRAARHGRHAQALVEAGWARWESHAPPVAAAVPAAGAAAAPTLEQQAALDTLLPQLDHFAVHLLHGVTGSGKTEVYLRLIEATLARARQALVLIPEIALTPQLEDHFRARFPGRRIVTLHSGLTAADRTENWLAATSCDLVLGTRLAVFAPLPRLGLIVVDEEHDASFKQNEGLRYSARDVAVTRAKQRGVPIVLGSATPALESYAHALSGRYRLIPLTQRANPAARLPDIELVDTRHLPLENGVSRPVVAALGACLARGEQSLVFLNRRGYAPVLYCPSCAWVSPCPRCSARLVLHRARARLKCHHCGYETRVPAACPDCGEPDLKALGHGTQRLEETLGALLPTARIRRIDRDSMRPRAWAELGAAVRGGHTDILVGTQMLAKGHDFPNMTLAVVLDTDGALYSPDFRATERLFAQLIQVAGRAGRADKPGRVLVQTAFPDHPLFRHLQRHDYPAFARELLAERRRLDLPPFSRQALVRAEAVHMDAAMAFLRAAAGVAPAVDGVRVFDPTPAPMARVASLHRAQLLVQSASRAALRVFLAEWRTRIEAIRPRIARWSLDVDPLEF
jgi:primosomal protein N' (replication factor Y)